MRCEMKVKQQNWCDPLWSRDMNANIHIICQIKPGLVISNVCRFKANATCTVQGVHQALSKTKPNIEVRHQQFWQDLTSHSYRIQPGDTPVKQIKPHATYSGWQCSKGLNFSFWQQLRFRHQHLVRGLIVEGLLSISLSICNSTS